MITCAILELRINADVRTKEASGRVDGGSEDYKVTKALLLMDQCVTPRRFYSAISVIRAYLL